MSYEWLRFVDLDRIAMDEEREKLMGMMGMISRHSYSNLNAWERRFKSHTLRDVIFSFAVISDNCKLLRFVSDLGASRKPPFGYQSIYTIACHDDVICLMIDMGIEYPRGWIRPITPFEESRNAARFGAIAAMGAIRSRLWRERERGWKDISRIIGRLVWESRKYYSDLPSPSKRIKNE